MKLSFFSRHAAVPEFHCPAGADPRTAVVHPFLKARKPHFVVRPGQPGMMNRICGLKPEAIAASFEQLLEVGSALNSDQRPAKAVVVFRGPEEPLSCLQRDRLWDLFQVPLYEQVLDSQARLLATECEAHDGMHILAEWDQLKASDIVDGPCECGVSARRVIVAPLPAQRPATAA